MYLQKCSLCQTRSAVFMCAGWISPPQRNPVCVLERHQLCFLMLCDLICPALLLLALRLIFNACSACASSPEPVRWRWGWAGGHWVELSTLVLTASARAAARSLPQGQVSYCDTWSLQPPLCCFFPYRYLKCEQEETCSVLPRPVEIAPPCLPGGIGSCHMLGELQECALLLTGSARPPWPRGAPLTGQDRALSLADTRCFVLGWGRRKTERQTQKWRPRICCSGF